MIGPSCILKMVFYYLAHVLLAIFLWVCGEEIWSNILGGNSMLVSDYFYFLCIVLD